MSLYESIASWCAGGDVMIIFDAFMSSWAISAVNIRLDPYLAIRGDKTLMYLRYHFFGQNSEKCQFLTFG